MINSPIPKPLNLMSVLEDGKALAKKLDDMGNVNQQHQSIQLIRPKGLAPSTLCQLESQSNLQELELEYVPINASNIDSLIKAISASPLKRLVISNNAMPEACIGKLYQAILVHNTLSDISINGMWLDSRHLGQILELFKKPTLKKIDLRFNQFSRDDVDSIYNAAKDSFTLEELKLSRNDTCLAEHLLTNALNNIQFKLIDTIIEDIKKCSTDKALNQLRTHGNNCFNQIQQSEAFDKKRFIIQRAEFNFSIGLAQASLGHYDESVHSLNTSLSDFPDTSVTKAITKAFISTMKRARGGDVSHHKIQKFVKMASNINMSNMVRDRETYSKKKGCQ